MSASVKMKRIKQTDCKKANKIVERTLIKLFNRAGPELKQLLKTKDRTMEGSVRCNLKVDKPDEFDIQIPINISSEDIKLLQKGKYLTNKDCDCGKHAKSRYRLRKYTNTTCKYDVKDVTLSPEDFGKEIISVTKQSVRKKLDGLSLLHEHYLTTNAVTLFTVKKLEEAVQDINNENSTVEVTLSKLLNTPAILVKIDADEIGHCIDVDIVPSLNYPMPSLSSRRVRIITERLKELPRKTQAVVDEDLCLVPKFDEAWKLSFSKFENNVLDSFYDGDDSDDEDYDCKKDCLRYAKVQLLKWKGQSSTELKQISSYLLKTLLFRACSKKPKKSDWSKECYVQRYLEMMKDFSQCLSKRKMEEFFNSSVNLLERKKDAELKELKEYITEEIKRIYAIIKNF